MKCCEAKLNSHSCANISRTENVRNPWGRCGNQLVWSLGSQLNGRKFYWSNSNLIGLRVRWSLLAASINQRCECRQASVCVKKLKPSPPTEIIWWLSDVKTKSHEKPSNAFVRNPLLADGHWKTCTYNRIFDLLIGKVPLVDVLMREKAAMNGTRTKASRSLRRLLQRRPIRGGSETPSPSFGIQPDWWKFWHSSQQSNIFQNKALTEDKDGVTTDNFYELLECAYECCQPLRC